jgi:hypothetical protein
VDSQDRAPARRVSDSDRETAVGVLGHAVADGRLTLSEYEERLTAVLAARTQPELDGFLSDVAPPAPVPMPDQVAAVCSKIIRGIPEGRRVEAKAILGAALLDVSGLAAGEVAEISASSLCGKVLVCVGHRAMVIDEGVAVLGKRSVPGPPSQPDGSIVRITGRSVLGNLRVVRPDSIWAAQLRMASGHITEHHHYRFHPRQQ